MRLKIVRKTKASNKVYVMPYSKNVAAGPLTSCRSTTGAQERRGDIRHQTEDRVWVEIACGSLLRAEGKALDISEHGLRLELEQPLSKGMPVQVTFAEGALILFGDIQYCRPAGGRYTAGISVNNVAAGSRPDSHCGEDDLILYLGAQGLTAPEVFRLQQHLKHCPACSLRLNEERRILDRIESAGKGLARTAQRTQSIVAMPVLA
jgi:hypothetical protein